MVESVLADTVVLREIAELKKRVAELEAELEKLRREVQSNSESLETLWASLEG